MDETKVQIGEDVLLDIGTHSDWYISAVSYDGKSVNVELHRKADQYKEWWLADTPQTEETCERCVYVRGSQWCQGCNGTPKRWDGEKIVDTPQTDCPKMTEEEFDTMLAKVLVGQTESTGSPIGDYRDGVGAWQTDCGWK